MSKQERENNLRLYAIVRADLLPVFRDNPGKLVAQAGHAYVGAILDASKRFPEAVEAYLATNHAKIALKAASAAQLQNLYEQHKDRFGAALITDAGHTVFDSPTITFLGLGPMLRSDIPKKLQALSQFPLEENNQ